DRWTQDDFYGLAAFLGRTRVRGLGISIGDEESPVGYRFDAYPRPLEARYLDGRPAASPTREELARLITEDPQFARAAVNRVWARLFGRGLVDPFDDFAPSRPPSDPQRLDALATAFAKDGFDLRRLVHSIVTSRDYQRKDAPLRPLTPEQHFGALARATRLEDATLDADAIEALLPRFQALYGSRKPISLL